MNGFGGFYGRLGETKDRWDSDFMNLVESENWTLYDYKAVCVPDTLVAYMAEKDCDYILIDRANEDKETAVHFLNQVDEADLMALTEDGQAEEKPAACTCAEKCQAGAVNTACPVCAVNMSECAGKAPEVEPEPEPEPEKESGSSGGALVLILLLAALGGGGAFAYIKFIKPKQGAKVSADPDDYEFEDEEYENEDVPEQGEQEDQN